MESVYDEMTSGIYESFQEVFSTMFSIIRYPFMVEEEKQFEVLDQESNYEPPVQAEK